MSLSEVSHLPLIQFIFVVSSYASCVCRRMHCLLDAPLLLSFFLLLLGFLIVQRTQSFFILWTVTLLKHLFKIISVWLCHHSFTKYFYTMANYTISAFGFNLQHFMLITAFFIYNYPKVLLYFLSHWVSKWKICVIFFLFLPKILSICLMVTLQLNKVNAIKFVSWICFPMSRKCLSLWSLIFVVPVKKKIKGQGILKMRIMSLNSLTESLVGNWLLTCNAE